MFLLILFFYFIEKLKFFYIRYSDIRQKILNELFRTTSVTLAMKLALFFNYYFNSVDRRNSLKKYKISYTF